MKIKNNLKNLSALIVLMFPSISLADGAIDKYPDYFLGKAGWVLSKSDYIDSQRLRNTSAGWPQTHFEFLNKIVKALESKNINVIVSVIPQRTNVYPQYLPDDLFKEYADGDNSYYKTLNEVKSRGINTSDLLKAIKNSKFYSSRAGVYYRFEPHWNFYGASAAADAVFNDIRADFSKLSLPQSKFVLSIGKPIDRKDTIWLDNLPKSVQATVPKDSEVPYSLKSNVNSDGLLSDVTPMVTLVGTSFTGYGFRSKLMYDMQADILDQSLPGKGMWTPMAQYLSSRTFIDHPPKLIIWEMPEYILSNYPMPSDSEYQVFKSILNVDKP